MLFTSLANTKYIYLSHAKIDPCQYSRKGLLTTDALLCMLQAIHEVVDSGEAGARIFFADDHTILMHELSKLEVHPALLSWIAALTGC